jgi:energy-coupling factor transporter ATP-binding protein EcfA2
VKIWAARNRGAISVHIEGGAAVTPFKQRANFLTAYIPGLAGLSERETILAQPLMRRTAASGDAGGVLRNVIYNLAVRQSADEAPGLADARLKRLNQLLQRIHPNVELNVGFDEREDIHINATFFTPGQPESRRSLEDLATGVLQVIQIFAYLILFRPKILLVDEPDAHLHPDKQERLIEALEEAAGEFAAQIIVTTHSQHVVRAASPKTQLVWMRDGSVVGQDEANIRRLMGWGALDKKVLFFVEDEEDEAIRQLLRQWPHLLRQLSVCRCFGVENLPKQPMIRGLISEDELDIRILLHRDRDYMTDEEVEKWRQSFVPLQRTSAWVTKHVDVEAYFCQPSYLQATYGLSAPDAERIVDEAAKSITGARKQYLDKRSVITRQMYPAHGGSPNSEKLWEDAGGQTRDTVLGKALHKALKQKLHERKLDPTNLAKFVIPHGIELAADLRAVIQAALAA